MRISICKPATVNYLRKFIRCSLSVTLLSGAMTGDLVAGEATFLGLGVIPNMGIYSTAFAVSDSGGTVSGSNKTASGTEPARWTIEGGMTGLGDFNGGVVIGRAAAISANGLVIAGSGRINSMPGGQAFRWTEASGTVFLGSLPGGVEVSQARDISADGNVIVGSASSDQGQRAVVWTPETGSTNLGTLNAATATSATGVSGNGLVVVGNALSAGRSEAFIWSESTGMLSLGAAPNGANYIQARAVSYDGNVIAGKTSDDPNILGDVFRWSNVDGPENLGHISSTGNVAKALSSDGSIIVGGVTSGGTIISPNGAFVWTRESGLIHLKDLLERGYGLNLTGWTLNSAEDISPDGSVIVGFGFNSIMGRQEGFKAMIPPGALPCTQEVMHDGIDQDCNGYDLSIDAVTAAYNVAKRNFTIEASSSLGKNAALTVDGLGAMKYNNKIKGWTLSFRKYDNPPSTVIIRGKEGFVTSSVIYN